MSTDMPALRPSLAEVMELSHKLQPWRTDKLTALFCANPPEGAPFCRTCADWHTVGDECSATMPASKPDPLTCWYCGTVFRTAVELPVSPIPDRHGKPCCLDCWGASLLFDDVKGVKS